MSKLSQLSRKLKYELDKVIIFQMVFSSSYLLFFLVVPILTILIAATQYDVELLFQTQYVNLNPTGKIIATSNVNDVIIIKITGQSYGTILNSLINASIVTLVASFLGVLVAFVLARYTFPFKNLLRIMAIVPLLITPFVNAYVIKKLFGPTFGYNTVSWLISSTTGQEVRIMFSDLAGVALTQIITFYPIVYLNVYSAMMNIDPSLEEQAENMGAKGLKLFRTVTFPLSIPGLAAGAALVFIFSLEDVAAPIIFGVREMLSYQIYNYFQGVKVGQNNPETGALAFLMLFFAMSVFIIIRNYVGLKQYAMISKGGRWTPRLRKPGLKGLLAIYFLIFPLVIATMAPQLGVIALAFSEQWGQTPLPEGFTTRHIMNIINNPGVFQGIVNSLTYSTIAVILIIFLGLSASYVVSRLKVKGIGIIDTLATSPLAIPGLVVAYGYFYFFNGYFKDTILDPIKNPALPIIIAYSVRKLPFTARAIYAGLQQTHSALEEASMNLGAGRLKTLLTIVVPLIAINIASGAMISFVYCMSETSVSITLGGLGGDVTSPDHKAPITMVMLDLITTGKVDNVQLAAALGFLLILLQIGVIVVITMVFKQSYAFIGV